MDVENENASSLAPLAAARIVMAAALVSLVQRCSRERAIIGTGRRTEESVLQEDGFDHLCDTLFT